jgi:hypothetical protein
MPSKRSPAVGKSTFFPFQTAAASWIDLLGYGGMIAEAGFNPLHPRADQAIRRLRRFHRLVAHHSRRAFPTLVMNDGAVAYRDLSYRTRWVTYEFLQDSWQLFEAINAAERQAGDPGARMVLATGFRMRGRRDGLDAVSAQFSDIIGLVKSGRISLEQAIGRAARIRSNFDVVPQLQANFAFTKAYVAEQSGSRAGLGGANFFVDLSLFPRPLPTWLDIGEVTSWSDARLGLTADFAALRSLPFGREVVNTPNGQVEGGPEGILDGLQVAQQLANDKDVLTALRRAKDAEVQRPPGTSRVRTNRDGPATER